MTDTARHTAWTDEQVEAAARAIALSYGQDPDEDAPLSVMTTADNQPVPWWKVYEEQARAALAALTKALEPST